MTNQHPLKQAMNFGPAAEFVRRAQQHTDVEQLKRIREQHVADFHEHWAGMEFGKALVGRMLDRAIAELEAVKPQNPRTAGMDPDLPVTCPDCGHNATFEEYLASEK